MNRHQRPLRDVPPVTEPDGLDVFQSRMVAAGEAWLAWCAGNSVNPLDASVEQIQLAADDLLASGRTPLAIIDLVDQVGSMTGQWRSRDWLVLRRTIDAHRDGQVHFDDEDFVPVQGGSLRTHGPAKCASDQACPIHRPSGHPLTSAPMARREDLSLLERICRHGAHHPDPDALEHARRTLGTAAASNLARHACDGCCTGEI